MARLLVLRPEPAAGATAKKIRELGLSAVIRPLFSIKAVDWKAPDPASFDGLLLTSANAVRWGGEEIQRYRGLKTFAVGEATAEAARDAGFDLAATGDSGVDRLLGSIDPELKLLHLCGDHRRAPTQARQTITPVPVYRSEEIENPELKTIADALALIHSPRAGRRFATLVDKRKAITIAAISNAAAEAVGEGWKKVEIADAPNDDALLALAARLCKNAHPE